MQRWKHSGSSGRNRIGYRFLLSRRWLGLLLLAALFAAACIGLGNWQMDRRNQIVAEIRRVQENYDKTPVPFQSVRNYFETPVPDAKWTTSPSLAGTSCRTSGSSGTGPTTPSPAMRSSCRSGSVPVRRS